MAECDRVIEKLVDYLKNLDTNSTHKWKQFLSMLRANKENIVESIELESSKAFHLFGVIFDQLLCIGCEDKNTVKRILSTFCGRRLFNIRINPISSVEMMNTAFKCGISDLMAVMVEYGLVDGALKENVAEFRRAGSTIVAFRSHAIEKDWLTVVNDDEELDEFYTNLSRIMEDMRSSCFHKSVFQRGVRRILLLTRLLSVLQLKQGESWLEERIACFKLFLKVIPDPFISLDELLAFLQIILNRRMNIEGQKSIAEMYKEYFPFEASSTYQPRSLKHLCRVSIRQEYRKQAKALRVSINRMCIPETLKDFLIRDCEE